MDVLFKLAGSVRSILFTCKTRSNDSVDPMVRLALAETVEHDREDWQNDFISIQAELERVSLAWQQTKDREQFLDTRIRKYRKTLRERSKELAETPHEPDYEQRRSALDRDDELLRKIQETHKEILVQCETMRRQLQELERKRDDMVRIDAQLHSFVDSALSNNSIRIQEPALQEQHQQPTTAVPTASSLTGECKDPEECLTEERIDAASEGSPADGPDGSIESEAETTDSSVPLHHDPSQKTEPKEP